MRKTIEVAFATVILALCLTKAAAAPVEGTWEGKINGQKALTLQITETGGRLHGRLTLYVVDTKFGDPAAVVVGQTEHDAENLRWEGKTLRFSITGPDVTYEMEVNGPSAATLHQYNPDLTMKLTRQ